jgi:hypothetical protein
MPPPLAMGALSLCPASALDLTHPCVRSAWATFLPVPLVAALLVRALPLPSPLRPLWDALAAPFQPFLTLPEAEAILAGAPATATAELRNAHPRALRGWRSTALCVLAMPPALGWAGLAAFSFAAADSRDAWTAVKSGVLTVVWLYAALRPLLAPRATPDYGLVALHAFRLVGGALVLGGVLYDVRVGQGSDLSTGIITCYLADTAAATALLLVLLSTPIALPGPSVTSADIGTRVSPEDYTTLWGALSFGWVSPLIAAGAARTLHEADVCLLSPTLRAMALSAKFAALRGRTLLRKYGTRANATAMSQAHDGEEPDCGVLRTALHRHGFNVSTFNAASSARAVHCACVNILFPWTVRPATST